MRLLHFIYDHPDNPWVGGGGARRTVLISRRLAERGHEICLVCGRYPGAQDYAGANLSIRFVGSGRGYVASTFSYAHAARRIARGEALGYDLLLEDFAPWNPVFTYRVRARPAVVQVQNYFGRHVLRRYPVVGVWFYGLERYYPRRFKHAIVINQALNDALGLRGEVISMGVDEELLALPVQTGEYIAFLGRLDIYQKGLDLLLRAARQTGLPVCLAGDGPGRTRLQADSMSLANVRWVGPVEGKAKVDFLRGARFVVVPSRFEGQNLVVLEAAALGKAVVVSDIAELAYAPRQGFGLPFKAGDGRDLAEKLAQLWHGHARRHSLEEYARPYVRDLTWPRIVDQFERYGERVIRRDDG
jgi:glycosyltransferase involved in cell wall biosynthesis